MDRPPPSQRTPGVLQGVTLLLPSGLSIMAIVVLVPILPLLIAHFHSLPNAEYRVPMLLTIPAACLVFASPIAGWIADRTGRRRLLLVAMAGYAAIGSLPILLDDYWAIFASRVALGMVEAVVLTVSTTLIGDYFKGPARARWLGYQIGVASIFATTLIFVGGVLSVYGWRGPFAVYSSALVMMLAIALFTWELDPGERDAHAAQSDWSGFPWAKMATLCALTLLASILFYFVLVQLPIVLAARGMPPSARTGFWLAVVSLGVTAGTLIFGQIARIGPPRLLTLAFALLAIGFAVMSGARSTPLLIFGAIVNQIGAGILMPTLLTWSTSDLPFRFRGRGTGMWQGAFSLGQFVMPILVTGLSASVGGLGPAIAVFSGVAGALCALFLVLTLVRSPRTSAGKRVVTG